MSAKSLISFDEIAAENPYFLDLDYQADWQEVFGNDHPLKLEIGFGNGSFLIEMAAREPEHNFIGLDFYHKGIRKAVTRIQKLQLQNIRIAYGDARERIPLLFGDESLYEAFINFPDPWPKKRHHKRRLIKPPFIEMLTQKLVRTGRLHIATDDAPYAREIVEVLEAEPGLQNKMGPGVFLKERWELPKSKYEKNFIHAGQKIYYLEYLKK